MSNERFELYTRSSSFAVTLSSPMIDRLLVVHTVRRLSERFEWYHPGETGFGTPEGNVAQWLDSTSRALVRRGLMTVEVPEELPTSRFVALPLTTAGLLMARLLIEAGFQANPALVPSVPPHPDDRIPLDSREFTPHDRRIFLAYPEDLPFLSGLRGQIYVDEGIAP